MAEHKTNERNAEVFRIIEDILKDIRYGSVTLVIQDGKVIQINKEEKIRM